MQRYPDLINNPDNDPRITQQQYEDWYLEQQQMEDWDLEPQEYDEKNMAN
jgi:hypothetical protein